MSGIINGVGRRSGRVYRNTLPSVFLMRYSVPDHFAICKEEIKRILRGFDIHTCPHTRLSDPDISGSYDERYCVS
ncbi:hypothetical protein BDV19DRAFT_370211 [Aspergillus venezuelensis]